ncbi:hypothetical protein BGW38_009017, partial [Lunasporangiospora selenospora]
MTHPCTCEKDSGDAARRQCTHQHNGKTRGETRPTVVTTARDNKDGTAECTADNDDDKYPEIDAFVKGFNAGERLADVDSRVWVTSPR